MKTHKYELEDPFSHEGTEIKSLEMRKPTWRDAKASDAIEGDAEKGEFMISSLTGIPPEALNDMSLADFQALGQIVEYFSTPKSGRGELELPT